MEERLQLKTLLFVSLGFLLAFFAINVKSQQNGNLGNVTLSPPMARPPPPPRLSPPPPSPLPSPPPPPRSPPPPSPSPPPPSFSPPFPPPIALPPPPPRHSNPSPKLPNNLNANSQLNRDRTQKGKNGSNLNLGQKIGLLFGGIVVIMQIGVVGFLAFKRRQLLKTCDR